MRRSRTNACLTRKHQRIGSIKYCIGYVTDFSTRGTALGNHRIKHLRCHNDRLSRLATHLDGPFLHEWNHLEWKFNPKISPGNHDPVECGDDVFKVVDRLWFFYLGKDGESQSLFIHDCVYVMNICRGTHK